MDRLSHGNYEITWAEERHAPAFVDLHREVFGTWEPMGRAQYDWKYVDNPAIEEVPVVVVEDDAGDLVGARGYFALPIRAGERRLLGLQSCDLMVHPDHRRQGLFRRMNELGLATYDDEDVVFFSFPGPAPRQGYLADGWQEVANPAFVRHAGWSPDEIASARDVLLGVASAGLAGVLSALDRVTDRLGAVDVSTVDGDAAGFLARLYDTERPPGLHTERTERFYEWRLAEPVQPHTTYVARRDDRVVGAAVVSEWEGTRVVRDLLPYGLDAPVAAALLREAARDARDADFLHAWQPTTLDRSALLAAGLLPETVLPFVGTNDDLVTLGVPEPAEGVDDAGRSSAAATRPAPDPAASDGGRTRERSPDDGGATSVPWGTEPNDWDLQLLARDY